MSPNERLIREVDEILKTIKTLIFDKIERKIDEETGDSYWEIKYFIPGKDIDRCETLLNDCCRLFREAKVSNTYKKYFKYSRMIAHVRMDYLPKSLTQMLDELKENEGN